MFEELKIEKERRRLARLDVKRRMLKAKSSSDSDLKNVQKLHPNEVHRQLQQRTTRDERVRMLAEYNATLDFPADPYVEQEYCGDDPMKVEVCPCVAGDPACVNGMEIGTLSQTLEQQGKPHFMDVCPPKPDMTDMETTLTMKNTRRLRRRLASSESAGSQ